MLDNRCDAIHAETRENRADLHTKFGSKNLINFGFESEKNPIKDIEDKLLAELEHSHSDITQNIEQLKKDLEIKLKLFDSMLASKSDKRVVDDTHDKFSIQLEKFV